ncbi:MAG: type I restriction-modification system subunit M [Nocardioidaceae bacterium]
MPARTKAEPTAPSTMKELKDTLWKAADKLRGSLSSSQYKDVILGLVFLKYVSDAYAERRATIARDLGDQGYDDEQIAEPIDDPEEYQGYGVFVVPEEARWGWLAQHAKGLSARGAVPGKTIGTLVNEAMDLLMDANPSLRGTLPRDFNKEHVDQRRLGELVDLFSSTRFSRQGAQKARDLMGEVYEYFLGNFARAEGKRGGEFFTPRGVVRLMVEILQPTRGTVYDPCCGSGGMFVQTERFIYDHGGDPKDVRILGQENVQETWRMAKMNLAIHGIDNGGLGATWGDTFARDQHPGVFMDHVLANPPFNIKDWARNEDDARWQYGVPPATNANYAWIQHILSKLKAGGSAGVVMANGSMSTSSGGEGQIRAAIVEADKVACMVALPTQLFRSTGIPVCLWFFGNDKRRRAGEVLFIDARELGFMVDRAERALSEVDIARIADTYHAWLGADSPLVERSRDDELSEYADVPGFCASKTLAEIKASDYALTPGRYVGAPEAEDDGEPIADKVTRLRTELLAAFDESNRLEQVVREQLGRL